ncbi:MULTISPECIES: amidohydrolase family protein [unclassified Prochlorococcus]|uniref:amidohydrolase family protein n=1 Tax=unclassified Prochlorococcus TaxID=2627481 RepID=UPI00056BD71C|nr:MULTISPECIES: amidohydrolase family protein [unclassified Prochlorococcus]
MFAQKQTSSNNNFLEALVPQSLIASIRDLSNIQTTNEGLCPIKIDLELGRIREITSIEKTSQSNMPLLLPRLIEPHAHIDKAFTWKDFPNLSGTYQGAMKANLEEHKDRTKKKVRTRANRSLQLALQNGVRAMRSHVDSVGEIGDKSWEVLLEIKDEWKPLIELQLVALVPLDYWLTSEGKDLARKVADEGGLLGGVIVPPYKNRQLRNLLFNFLALANNLGCAIDLHIDESDMQPACGICELLDVLDQVKIDVPITCSHLSSLGFLPNQTLERVAQRIANQKISVIALPLTNFWLLSRYERKTPTKRPLAPISQLQNAGVTVAIGGDNVQDPWNPIGDFDPIALMGASLPIAQIAPWERLGLATYTTGASQIMNLEWDGRFQIGSPADFVLLKADSWSGAMANPPERKIMIQGNWIE